MKRKFSLLLVLLIAISLLVMGCSSSTSSDTNAPAENEDSFSIRLAHHMASDSGAGKHVKKFTELVTERTDGKVEFMLYPDSQLGGERDVNENVMEGTIQMTLISSPTLGWLSPTMNVLNTPYLFESNEKGYELLNGSIGDQLNQDLIDQSGIRLVAWYAEGFRNAFTVDHPITTLEEWEGLKIRSPESDVYIDTLSALGANPTPTPWNEVYTALQTGVVTGAEAPNDLGLTARFHEVAKDVSLTNHIFLTQALGVNEEFWNTIPEDIQSIIQDTAKDVAKEYLDSFPALKEEQINQLKAEGATIHKPSDEELNRMKEVVQPVWNKIGEKYEVSDLIEEISSK